MNARLDDEPVEEVDRFKTCELSNKGLDINANRL